MKIARKRKKTDVEGELERQQELAGDPDLLVDEVGRALGGRHAAERQGEAAGPAAEDAKARSLPEQDQAQQAAAAEQHEPERQPLPQGLAEVGQLQGLRHRRHHRTRHHPARRVLIPAIDALGRAGLIGQLLDAVVELMGPRHGFRGEQILAGVRPVGDLGDRDLGAGHDPFVGQGLGVVARNLLRWRQHDPVEHLLEHQRRFETDVADQRGRHGGEVETAHRALQMITHLRWRGARIEVAVDGKAVGVVDASAEASERAPRARGIGRRQRTGGERGRGLARAGEQRRAQPEPKRAQQHDGEMCRLPIPHRLARHR